MNITERCEKGCYPSSREFLFSKYLLFVTGTLAIIGGVSVAFLSFNSGEFLEGLKEVFMLFVIGTILFKSVYRKPSNVAIGVLEVLGGWLNFLTGNYATGIVWVLLGGLNILSDR